MSDALYEKRVQCLYCHTSFGSMRVRISKIKASKRDTDFCTYFIGENPMFYEFYNCPHCGLAFTDSFSPIKGQARERIKYEYIDKIEVTNCCGSRTLKEAIRGYKLTLLCANILNEKTLTIANLCMRIAWLQRYAGNHEEERRFLQNAVNFYEQIYQTQSLATLPMEEGKLLYLIGEIHGRLDHYDKTRSWFSYVLTAKHIDSKWKSLVRDRWFDIKSTHSTQTDDPDGYNELSTGRKG
ncbi:DUF2225 domain-containing protein [Fodinisporobacter ferrooxydans]|uniref:DUF2225 domain-containing protein n=1 Tax=Fodinisporobacter ferrooxydans TaxID=2901836 RepID=A0ABY4CQ76_9BACL|nr:DUF2225 domain-containing protein [Alicyclobacillaceae bacterium MYW30-H2]